MSDEKQPGAAHFFAQHIEFIWGATKPDQLPLTDLPEVAFVGRSNVGKSSLINALVGRNSLARTSNTPGRTQQLNFFNLAERLMLVDLPGYGYAKVSKTQSQQWTRLMKKYLSGRAQLRRVCVLVDGRHGLKESDHEMMEMLDAAAVNYQVVLTKADKVGKTESEELLASVKKGIAKHAAAHPEVLLTSAEKRTGIAPLQETLFAFAKN